MQGVSTLLQNQVNKKEKREGDGNGNGFRVTSKKSKSKPNRHSASRDPNGTKLMVLSKSASQKTEI